MEKRIIFFLICIGLIFGNCKSKHENEHTSKSKEYYTCPMHLSVKSNSPGACPVCGMSLIKVGQIEEIHEGSKGNYIILDKRQQLLSGIETDTVKFRTIIPTSTILGTVAIDEEKVTTISNRVSGRIDKLFTKSSGEYIQKGSPVYEIYSEQLFADEKEFLALTESRQKNSSSVKIIGDMLNASKNKLLLWGLSENQISELEINKTASPQITFYSLAEGYVTEMLVTEGIFAEEGTPLIKLAGLKQVWIEAQVYSNEIMDINDSFQIVSEVYPDEIYNGRLAFINPSLEVGRKIQLLRIRVENTKSKLIPGMMVYVSPTRNTKPVLSVPKSAVLLEKMKTVWIRTDKNTFEQRMVETGAENRNLVEILSGITVGEVVVTSGAYLISSEFILKSGAGQRHDH